MLVTKAVIREEDSYRIYMFDDITLKKQLDIKPDFTIGLF